MERKIPRVMLAGVSSGCGKTTVTCGVLQALVNRGYRVGAFKCGPDYIDPMFHRQVIGTKSGNLDTFFTDEYTEEEEIITAIDKGEIERIILNLLSVLSALIITPFVT